MISRDPARLREQKPLSRRLFLTASLTVGSATMLGAQEWTSLWSSRRWIGLSMPGRPASPGSPAARLAFGSAAHRPGRGKPGFVTLVEFTETGKKKGKAMVEKVSKTDDEWRQVLSPEQFQVTRRAGTEFAFSGKYRNNHEKGIYRCVCCGNALFSSDTKFESGTGWPSFWAPLAEENIEVAKDNSHGMVRDEVRCKKCDAHLGHVFEDGPPPSHLRYCMNSAALNFVKGT